MILAEQEAALGVLDVTVLMSAYARVQAMM